MGSVRIIEPQHEFQHERKLLQALGLLWEAHGQLSSLAGDRRDSSRALLREARQASRHSHELVATASQLTEQAERLLIEARALRGESGL